MISVIIPVYMVENYIARCLSSVVSQIYTSWETILVDDMGTDGSMSVAEDIISGVEGKFAVVKHPRNLGLSSARNTGLKAARGKYVFFLDSDDEIPPDSLSKLIQMAEAENAEITVGNIDVFSPTNIRKDIFKKKYPQQNLTGNDIILEAYVNGMYPVMACNKLIRRDFLQQHHLEFLPNLLAEDELWSLQCALKLHKIAFVEDSTYFYHIRAGSIINSKSERHFESYAAIATAFFGLYQKESNLRQKKLLSRHLIHFKDMTLIMNWQATKKKKSWKKLYKSYRVLQNFTLKDYFSKYFPFKTKKLAFYQSFSPEVAFWIFRKRYGI